MFLPVTVDVFPLKKICISYSCVWWYCGRSQGQGHIWFYWKVLHFSQAKSSLKLTQMIFKWSLTIVISRQRSYCFPQYYLSAGMRHHSIAYSMNTVHKFFEACLCWMEPTKLPSDAFLFQTSQFEDCHYYISVLNF